MIANEPGGLAHIDTTTRVIFIEHPLRERTKRRAIRRIHSRLVTVKERARPMLRKIKAFCNHGRPLLHHDEKTEHGAQHGRQRTQFDKIRP
jgi:hypothetical protein